MLIMTNSQEITSFWREQDRIFDYLIARVISNLSRTRINSLLALSFLRFRWSKS